MAVYLSNTRQVAGDTHPVTWDKLLCRKDMLKSRSDNISKLDGVAPLMADPPPTNFTSFSTKKI